MTFCDVLPEELIEDMWKKHEKALESGIEIGFAICQVNGKFIRGAECIGDECHIPEEVISLCPFGSKQVGFFHSHINHEPTPSMADLYTAYFEGSRYECIAGISEQGDIIVCYDMSIVWDKLKEFDKVLKQIERVQKEFGVEDEDDILNLSYEDFTKYIDMVAPLYNRLNELYTKIVTKLEEEGSCIIK